MILLYEQDTIHSGAGVHIQTLLLDYTSLTFTQLDYPTTLKIASIASFVLTNLNFLIVKSPGITIFTLRNQVYITAFQEALVEIFEFDENCNGSFVLKQQMNLNSYLLVTSHLHISATPFWK